jgi:hypothetical protein
MKSKKKIKTVKTFWKEETIPEYHLEFHCPYCDQFISDFDFVGFQSKENESFKQKITCIGCGNKFNLVARSCL